VLLAGVAMMHVSWPYVTPERLKFFEAQRLFFCFSHFLILVVGMSMPRHLTRMSGSGHCGHGCCKAFDEAFEF
jgi:hypothetical protein